MLLFRLLAITASAAALQAPKSTPRALQLSAAPLDGARSARTLRLSAAAAPLDGARSALRGAASTLENPLKALEQEIREARKARDAAALEAQRAVAEAAAAENAARAATTDLESTRADRATRLERVKGAVSEARQVETEMRRADQAEAALRKASAETADLATRAGGNIAAFEAAIAAAEAATAEISEAFRQDAAAAELRGVADLEAARERLQAAQRALDEDPAEQSFWQATGAAAGAGYLLFADTLGGGPSFFSFCGAALGVMALLTLGEDEPRVAEGA